jgi:hypothetical protein
MAVEYLAGNRIRGTNAERLALSVTKSVTDSGVSTTGLKAYYNFDSIESSTTLTNQATTGDGLGSSANGTITSATLDTTNEKLGTGCYNFDGSDDYVKLGSSVSQWNFCHEANHKWSCAYWYRSNNAPTDYEYIIGNTRASSSDVGFVIGVHTSRRMYFAVVGTTKPLDDYLTANNIIPDDEWHHYTCTFDATLSSENLKIYRDGSQVDTANYASWTPSGGDAGRALYIGTDKGYSTGYLDGKLDDMGIWNRVLTSSEVSSLYLAPPNLVDGSIFYTTDTNKEYVLYNNTWSEV